MNDLRVIWAIAIKDIVDAVRNRVTLGALVSVLFLVGIYRVLPALQSLDEPPNVLAYDAGNSALIAYLENSRAIELWTGYRSETHMQEKLADGDVPELGLVIPADFDQALASDREAALQGYVMYWVSEDDTAELKRYVEGEVSRLLGRPVSIQLEGNVVYMQPASRGVGLLAGLGIGLVVLIIGVSLVPHLILEEKQGKTMDVLLVSPAGPFHVTVAKAIAGLFYAAVAVGVALALNHRLVTQWWLAALATLWGALFSIALGLLLGSLFETRQQLMLWAWMVIASLLIPMFLTVMQALLPAWLIALLRWVPSVALFDLLRVSFSNQASFGLYGPQLALLLACAAVLLALLAWRVRRSDR
jgi:ABC-type Na+ efflux pump permease subunit